MTKEQYEKLKEWIRLKAKDAAAKQVGAEGYWQELFEVERELDKLMGFEE